MVPIDFDRPRHLKFDLRAIKDLEANMGGLPLGTIVQNFMNIGVTAITVALWAGLKHEDKTLSPSLVTKMLEKYINDGKSLKLLGRALNDAMDETGLFKTDADEADAAEDAEGNVQTVAP